MVIRKFTRMPNYFNNTKFSAPGHCGHSGFIHLSCASSSPPRIESWAWSLARGSRVPDKRTNSPLKRLPYKNNISSVVSSIDQTLQIMNRKLTSVIGCQWAIGRKLAKSPIEDCENVSCPHYPFSVINVCAIWIWIWHLTPPAFSRVDRTLEHHTEAIPFYGHTTYFPREEQKSPGFF